MNKSFVFGALIFWVTLLGVTSLTKLLPRPTVSITRNNVNYHRASKILTVLMQFYRLAKFSLFFSILMVSTASAAPVYYLQHFTDTNLAGPWFTIGPQANPIEYNHSYTSSNGANTGEVDVSVNSGSISINAIAYNNGVDTPQRQQVHAAFTFDVMFGSAGNDPIDVTMNMILSGILDPQIYNVGALTVWAGTQAQKSSGSYLDIPETSTITKDGMLSSFVDDGTDHLISASVSSVPVNTIVSMIMEIEVSQAYKPGGALIDFGNTFHLSTIGDVFTIDVGQDISVNSVDAGIVDNRFNLPSAVPIPAAAWLFGSGLIGLVSLARRKKV